MNSKSVFSLCALGFMCWGLECAKDVDLIPALIIILTVNAAWDAFLSIWRLK